MKRARAVIVFLLALVAVGSYALAQQCIQGDAVTDLNTIGAGGAVWGLYVAGDGFFASAALASLVVACVIRVLRLREMEPVAWIALPLGIAGLLASLGCVLADLGRPMPAMVNLPLVGRPRSPFFGTFTLVAGASLFAGAIHLALASRPGWAARAQAAGRWPWLWRTLACGWPGTASAERRRERVDFWLSLAVLPVLLGGLVILGAVFGVRAGRPAWQGHFEVVTFVVSGGAAGCSLLALAAHARASVFMARMVAVLTGLTVLLVVSAEILALRTPYPSVQRYAHALLQGPWSGLFWTELVLLFLAGAIALAMSWRKTISPVWTATIAALLCAAVSFQRFLLLVAWQTHGLGLPWPAGAYHPTWIEWAVLTGVTAAAVLAFLLLSKTCAAQTMRFEPAAPAATGRRLRSLVTAACLVLGLALAGVGPALSAGFASAPFLDPIFPGGPLVFLAGLFMTASSAIAYELIPERLR